MHNMTTNVQTKVSGLDKIKQLFHFRNDIRPDINSNIDVHANTSSADELNHTINNIRNDVNHINKNMSGLSDDGQRSFGKLGGSAHKAETRVDALESVGHKIHGVFSGTFLGTQASQAIGSITSSAKSAISSGIKLVSVGRDTSRAWRNVGLNSNQANQMTEQMDDIRDKAGMDEQSINMMQKSFYSLTGSAPKAQSLTNELVSFGKATGESDRMISRMGRTLPRMLSTGKVSGQMFNRTFRQSPKLIGAIAKASGHTTGQFRQLAAGGKITSQQLMQYMQKAAKGSTAAWAEYTTTFQGQMNVIKGTWTKAKENFARPFVSNLTQAVNQATKSGGGLLKVQKTAAKLSTTLGKQVGNWSGKAIGWIVKNQKPLMRTGSAIFRIVKAIGSGVWKEFTSILTDLTGGTGKTTKGFNNFSKSLSRVASHTKQLQRFGRVLANLWLISKMQKFNKGLLSVFHSLTKFKIVKSLQTKLRSLNSTWQHGGVIMSRVKGLFSTIRHPIDAIKRSFAGVKASVGSASFKVRMMGHTLHSMTLKEKLATIGEHTLSFSSKTLSLSLRSIGYAIDSIPIVGWIQIAIDGLTEIYMHSAKFRHLVNPLLRFVGHMIGKIGDAIADVVGGIIKWTKRFAHLGSAVSHFFHHSSTSAVSANHKMASSTAHAASRSSHSIHGYLAKNGKYYKHYHKGLVKISSASYKMREHMRERYSKRTRAELSKYERNYRRYENKRNSLSQKYGKLRAMYSVKSLDLIEKRFRKLRSTILKTTRGIYKDTQKWFKKIGKGSANQFKGIYKAVRRWLGRSDKLMVKDYKAINKNSRRYLDGSVKRYVKELRNRFKSQKYYDGQLVKQTRRTNNIMNKLPLKWVYRETKLLNRNWRIQRKNFITHNKRMTKSLVTHIHTMSHHLRNFSKSFKDIFGDLESNIYEKWRKFWDRMHNAAGKGINSVQSPLNTGAEHLNDFVRAFGETSSPLHRMPSVSYATGTGALSGISSIRRPITQLTSAILNDDANHGQETVIHANGEMEKPQGANVHEILEPGAEVLNASETKLMDALSQPVHLATGTGFFSDLKGMLSGLGNFGGLSQSILFEQAKGKGDKRLLYELEKILKNSSKIFSGFMGAQPSGFRGLFDNIIQGLFAQTTSQMNGWWKALMNLTDQSLNNGGSSSALLNFAEKNFSGIPYSMGGMSKAAADCSGAVDMIAKHFGVDLPRTTTGMESDSSQLQYIGKDQSKARAGDLVLFGHGNGASGHVGIYTGRPDWMWNETPPRSRISRISDAESAVSLAGFYRLKHLSQDSNKGPSFKGANKGLMAFVKRQEAPMFKWISKHLAPLLNPDPGGGPGVAKWRPVIEDAAKAMGVHLTQSGLDKVLSNIRHESGGDEKVTQHVSDINSAEGDPAKGLVQFIPPTFRHYAVAGHDNILSGYDQLLALFNDSNWYSDIAPGGGWGPSGSRRHYKGGRFKAGDLFSVGEKGPELIKPDFSGEVIPNSQSKRIINNSHKPVNVQQDIHINVKGGSKADDKHIVSVLQHYGDKLAHKLNGGGDLIV